MDNIGIKPVDLASRVQSADMLKAKATGVSGSTPASFGTALAEALGRVSEMQNQSTDLAREFQLGNPNVSLEETMISAQKASVSFQAAVAVRSRVIAAYNEIMNMNV